MHRGLVVGRSNRLKNLASESHVVQRSKRSTFVGMATLRPTVNNVAAGMQHVFQSTFIGSIKLKERQPVRHTRYLKACMECAMASIYAVAHFSIY